MIFFKNTTVNLGKLYNSSSHNVEFLYTGNKKDIEFVKPDCGCTGSIITADGKISMQYDHNKGQPPHDTKKSKKIVKKGITVYLKDALPLKIKNKRDVDIYNPAKSKIRLEIVGTQA